ncbi:MAG: hypothetical protein ACKPEQ_38035, partial [Dolichospermum sp.]
MNQNQHKVSNWLKLAFFLLSFAILANMANAQNASVSYVPPIAAPDGAFTVCDGPERMIMRVANGNSFAMTGVNFTLQIPPGGSYVPGSITGATE